MKSAPGVFRFLRPLLPALVVASLIAQAGTARATEVGNGRPFGLGLSLGSPTAITAKYFLSPNSAIDGGLSFWSWGRYGGRWRGGDCWDGRRWVPCGGGYTNTRLGIYGDYLWEDTLARGTAKLDWHVGVGGRFWFYDRYYEDDLALAARVPVGLDLSFARPPFLELFFELAPAFYLIPQPFFDLEAAVGIRFYF